MRATDITEAQQLLFERRALRHVVRSKEFLAPVDCQWRNGREFYVLRQFDNLRLGALNALRAELTEDVRTAIRERIDEITARIKALGLQDDEAAEPQ